ncbi:hypothetical protein [Paenibacillus hubeiensis]|uniref:hypothetical protein n=1 Tax=Paenibacillus hubeiensis TaxID=3077330 RepID=UPI0031BA5E6C
MTQIWPEWTITTDHPASKDGVPVLVSPAGKVYRPEDVDPDPDRFNQTDLAKALGVSTAAIRDRISRGTVPEYDGFTKSGRGYWMADTIKHLIKGGQAE